MYTIVINPAAGHGHSRALLTPLVELFRENGMECEPLFTQAPMDARVMAREACASGREGIIGIGGDGTLQEIVTGMWEAREGTAIPTPLGIMPCGSGNDFILTVEGGKRKTKNDREAAEDFFQRILNKRMRSIDLIHANGMAFLNIANVGLDARIVQNAADLKKTFRHNAYLASAFKSILQHQNIPLRITVNGETHEGKYTLAAVCNGQYYGGGMRIAPHARIDDGKITVCLVEAMTRPKTMVLFPSVLIERHVRLKEIRFIECEKLTLTLLGKETLCMDGNLYGQTGDVYFEIMPGALKLFA